MIAEGWVSEDGDELTLVPADHPNHEVLITDDKGRKMRKIIDIVGRDWKHASGTWKKLLDMDLFHQMVTDFLDGKLSHQTLDPDATDDEIN